MLDNEISSNNNPYIAKKRRGEQIYKFVRIKVERETDQDVAVASKEAGRL